jgi:hypothetical protein
MSPKFTLNKKDLLKIGKGAIIAMSGAVLTYLLSVLPQIEFGQYTPIAAALLSIAINAGLKFIEGYKEAPVIIDSLPDVE